MFKINYCNQCGGKTAFRIAEGEDRKRDVCHDCGFIQYLNPRIIVGTLPTYQGKVLLCRRAIEPRKGYWTLPAGFMECGETAADGARRETMEEAGAQLTDLHLYALYDVPMIDQFYMFYRAEMLSGDFSAGVESLEVELFALTDIPWGEMAFPTITKVLRQYIDDLPSGHFNLVEARIG
ncbi:NADH pyrophosphatase [Sinobacterium norvegicum]|uniref:NADH pyrophosphatase n=1 Tax=Sinobacterium norvegicum TaxID=1641715 RepID=A0ABN8ECH4_9GAMM|nr:NUDIX hydrolase [Sinobacterium norvegicum]CAH0990186.1 NADH pyrophosphatase [Sinobacterium norvegicum]